VLFIVTRNSRDVESSAQASAEVLLAVGIVYLVVGIITSPWHGGSGTATTGLASSSTSWP
jgi:hypothetical protein